MREYTDDLEAENNTTALAILSSLANGYKTLRALDWAILLKLKSPMLVQHVFPLIVHTRYNQLLGDMETQLNNMRSLPLPVLSDEGASGSTPTIDPSYDEQDYYHQGQASGSTSAINPSYGGQDYYNQGEASGSATADVGNTPRHPFYGTALPGNDKGKGKSSGRSSRGKKK